jgi:hypothetical protein
LRLLFARLVFLCQARGLLTCCVLTCSLQTRGFLASGFLASGFLASGFGARRFDPRCFSTCCFRSRRFESGGFGLVRHGAVRCHPICRSPVRGCLLGHGFFLRCPVSLRLVLRRFLLRQSRRILSRLFLAFGVFLPLRFAPQLVLAHELLLLDLRALGFEPRGFFCLLLGAGGLLFQLLLLCGRALRSLFRLCDTKYIAAVGVRADDVRLRLCRWRSLFRRLGSQVGLG